MPAIQNYVSPTSLPQALQVLSEGKATILAGGTDLLPRWQRGLIVPPTAVVSLRCLPDLCGIRRLGDEVHIGACTPVNVVATDPLIASAAPVLAVAAGRIACPAIRNRATIGGNLCNASPAADTALPLLLLDAMLDVACAGPAGIMTREVQIVDFFRGPGKTVLETGDLLTCIRFKPLPEGTFAAWDKFGTRPAMEIAVAAVGMALIFTGASITQARIGYGSVAPVPLRGRAAESQLIGKTLSDEVIRACVAAARAEITPITDVRASADYRREVTGVLLRRMLQRAQHQRNG